MHGIVRFCVPVLTAACCGCAHIANVDFHDHAKQVVLEVVSGIKSGFLPQYGSDGIIYSYRYTGGDDGHGNIEIPKSEGASTVTIRLDADNDFKMHKMYFQGDTNSQLTADIKSQKIALIKDVNGERQTADYKIVVMHTDSGARTETVACDPRIVNN